VNVAVVPKETHRPGTGGLNVGTAECALSGRRNVTMIGEVAVSVAGATETTRSGGPADAASADPAVGAEWPPHPAATSVMPSPRQASALVRAVRMWLSSRRDSRQFSL
jgi:hypothetical protein